MCLKVMFGYRPKPWCVTLTENGKQNEIDWASCIVYMALETPSFLVPTPNPLSPKAAALFPPSQKSFGVYFTIQAQEDTSLCEPNSLWRLVVAAQLTLAWLRNTPAFLTLLPCSTLYLPHGWLVWSLAPFTPQAIWRPQCLGRRPLKINPILYHRCILALLKQTHYGAKWDLEVSVYTVDKWTSSLQNNMGSK